MPYDAIATGIMYVMVLIGGFTDIRSGKVPNLLTAPCAIAGIALSTLDSGLAGLGASLAGIAMGVAVWFVMPVLGKPLGGGDVKMFAAVGALQGPAFLLYVMVASALFAGLLALGVALSQRRLIATCRQLGQWIHGRVVLNVSEPLATAAAGAKVPFAAAIALGAFAVSAVVR